MKTKQAPRTHAEHEANRLRKQVEGHQRLIADLQQALRIARSQADGKASVDAILLSGCAMLERIARDIAAELPEERRAEWVARYAWLGAKKEKMDDNDLEVATRPDEQVIPRDAARRADSVRPEAG